MNCRIIYSTLTLLITTVFSYAQTSFQVSYGGLGSDYGRAVKECIAGGFIVAGSTNSYGEPSTDIYVLRIDELGNYLWGKNIGEAGSIDWAEDIAEDIAGNFYIVGHTNRNQENGYDGVLLKLGANGEELGTWLFGSFDWDFLSHIEISPDGFLYLAGSTTINNKEVGWLIKSNLEGEIAWETTIPSPNPNPIKGLTVCSNGLIAFAGEQRFANLDTLQYLGVISDDGIIDWLRVYTEFSNQTVGGCTCIDDEYIVSTATQIVGADNFVFNTKVSILDGDIIWNRTDAGLRVRTHGIDVAADGNLIFAGEQEVNGNGFLDAVSYEFSPEGEFISGDLSEVQGGFGDDIFYDIEPTSDGGYICVGETNSFDNNWQVLVSKIGPNGESIQTNTDYLDITTPVRNRTLPSPLVTLFPNPNTGLLNLRLSDNGVNTNYHYQIVDVTGKVLKTDFYSSQVNVSNLEQGCYFFLLLTEPGEIYSQTRFLKIN